MDYRLPPHTSRQRSVSNSSALSSLAAFSRKHLVPPTPGTSSRLDRRKEPLQRFPSTPTAAYSYSSRAASISIMPGPASGDSEVRFAGFKRTLHLHSHSSSSKHSPTYLTTPEEDRGHASPLKHLAPPPTIQQIASGVATRSSHILPTAGSRSSSSSLSSITSSPTLPPIPLRSSLKKSLTNESTTPSYSSSQPLPRQQTNHKPFGGVRNLFQKHNFRPSKASNDKLDDAGSFLSDGSDSTKRIIGRVRFSDADGEGTHDQLSRRVTLKEKARGKDHFVMGVETFSGAPPLSPPPSVPSSRSSTDSPATTIPVLIPGATGGPVKLNLTNTRKNVMKMLHIGTP